jgi:hypothetical protein
MKSLGLGKMIRKGHVYFLGLVLLLAGCINFAIRENHEAPKLVEVVLVTNTPQQTMVSNFTMIASQTGTIPALSPTSTWPVTLPRLTLMPSTTNTATPAPTGFTDTPMPTIASSSSPAAGPLEITIVQSAKCRSGPGIVYDVITYLSIGNRAFAEGRNKGSDWFLISQPNLLGNCWVADQLVELEGEVDSLPVLPDPPTPTPKPTPTLTPKRIKIYPKGDINHDCVVDDDDYDIWLAAFGSAEGDSNYDAGADLNGDGKVDGLDYGIWWQNYGKTCTYREK